MRYAVFSSQAAKALCFLLSPSSAHSGLAFTDESPKGMVSGKGQFRGIEDKSPNPPGVAHSNFLLTLGLYPVFVSLPLKTSHKLPSCLWPELTERNKTESLRQLAKEYGVSHECVRRALVCANKRTPIWTMWPG
jgi:hypothetical protein